MVCTLLETNEVGTCTHLFTVWIFLRSLRQEVNMLYKYILVECIAYGPEGDNIISGDDVVPTLNLSLFLSAD